MRIKGIFTYKNLLPALMVILVFTLSMIMNRADAANYYVSAKGNDAANGLTPFLNIFEYK